MQLGQANVEKDPFIRRVIVCALAAAFLMAAFAVFIMGEDSALTALMLTLGSSLAGIGGWGIARRTQS